MDEKTIISDPSLNDFFLRAGLASQDRLDCYAFIEEHYQGLRISPATSQGYCSFTVFVGDTLVIQFRPAVYKLDLRIARAAREVYGAYAPVTTYLGTLPSELLAYGMNKVDGISFEDMRSVNKTVAQSMQHRRRLCKDFAAFLAKAWHRSDTSIPLGTIGLSLVSRLKALITDLPTRFQSTARNLLKQIHRIEALPWVLTHGDVIASNIMVDPSSCCLRGFVDWAEAERLPFGVCFYGLEEILAEKTPRGFCYCPDSEYLRKVFWDDLKTHIPELQHSHVLQSVKLARDLGVLLWHGIAFDNGAINRVVEEGRDIEEIHRLDAFLDLHVQQHTESSKDSSNQNPPVIFPNKVHQRSLYLNETSSKEIINPFEDVCIRS